MHFVDHTAPAGVSPYITVIHAVNGQRLNKGYLPDLHKKALNHPRMVQAETVAIDSLEALQGLLDSFEGQCDTALVHGDHGLTGPFEIWSEKWIHERLPEFKAPAHTIKIETASGLWAVQRAAKGMAYSRWVYADIDAIPSEIPQETVVRAFQHTFPEMGDVRILVQPSSSTGLSYHGQPLKSTYGLHLYWECATPERLKAFFESRKKGFDEIGFGTLDTSVFGQSNRINYGSPQLAGGVTQSPRVTWISEGTQTEFTVDPAWLPVKPSLATLPMPYRLEEVVPEKHREAATNAAEEWLHHLVDELEDTPQGSRHVAWRNAAWFAGGARASGCLQMPVEAIEGRFMTALEGWSGWDDKSPDELLKHLQTGLEKGAEKPCWPMVLVRKQARWLEKAGATPELLGIRLSLMEYPLYDPLEGEGVYRQAGRFMELPLEGEQAIREAQAAGRKVTVLMRGPMGVGKTEVAKRMRALCKGDFTLVTPSISLARTGATRLGLDCYQEIRDKRELRKRPNLSICQDSTPHLCPTHGNPAFGPRFIYQRNVLVDEVEQVMSRFAKQGGLAEAYRTTEAIMEDAQLLILADASLRQSTVEQVQALRPDALVISLIHTGKMLEGRIVCEVTERAALVSEAQKDVERGEPVFFVADSWKEAAAVFEQLRTALRSVKPEGKALLITSKTRESANGEVQALLANPQKARDYDLLVASPTISTGIDFTFRDKDGNRGVIFKKVYGCFGGNSVGAEQALQMLRRVRDAEEIVLYCNPATWVQPKKDYPAMRERVRKGQFYEVLNYSPSSAFQEWVTEKYTVLIAGRWEEFENPLPATLTLKSEMYETIAAMHLDLRDISQTALRINLLEMLKADGATVTSLEVGAGKIAEAKDRRKEIKRGLRENWVNERLQGTYFDPNTRETQTGLAPYSIQGYASAKGAASSDQGAEQVRRDRFLLGQLEPGKAWSAEELNNLYDKIGEVVSEQQKFEFLRAKPEFLRAHDMLASGMVDLGNRKEISKIVRLIKHLSALVGLDLAPPVAAEGKLPPRFSLYTKEKKRGGKLNPLAASGGLAHPLDWRWVPTPESVGKLLRAVAEVPDVQDILGLTATTHEQMIKQFNKLLQRFGMKLHRVRDGEASYYTLRGWDTGMKRMVARADYVATLSDIECEVVQHLQIEARRRVLENAGYLAWPLPQRESDGFFSDPFPQWVAIPA
jgi:hypothetical protein